MSALAQIVVQTVGVTPGEAYALLTTVGLVIITLVVMIIFLAFLPNLIGIALSAGALGGFIHELVQSKGTVLFVQQKADGIYLGSIAGLVFGLVSGAFTIQGNLGTFTPTAEAIAKVFFEAFLGGLALKGVTDAGLGSFKSKDDFDVTAVSLQPNGASITVRNKMQSKLTILQVVVTHIATGQTHPDNNPNPNNAAPMLITPITANFPAITWTHGNEFEFKVYTVHGEGQIKIKAP